MQEDIIIKDTKVIYVLKRKEIIDLLKTDLQLWEKAIKRGKSEKRYRINESRKQPWERDK